MTQSERSKKHYQGRRERNECPKCGNKLDRKGFYCNKCLKKRRDYVNETRAFMRSIGICPQCQRNSLIGEQKICLECLAYQAEWRAKKQKNITEEQLKAKRTKNNARYAKRIADKKCTACGKRPPALGRRKCAICLEKDAIRHRNRRKE